MGINSACRMALHARHRHQLPDPVGGGSGAPPAGCTFFNFTASHDGIGMRPIKVSCPRQKRPSCSMQAAGGKINWRAMPDGSQQPYELNITYYSPPQASR